MHGYLIDMDGVIYRGSQLIPGADRFIHGLLAADVPFSSLETIHEAHAADGTVDTPAWLMTRWTRTYGPETALAIVGPSEQDSVCSPRTHTRRTGSGAASALSGRLTTHDATTAKAHRANRLTELEPRRTAGYGPDARRFCRQIDPARKRLKLAREYVVRLR